MADHAASLSRLNVCQLQVTQLPNAPVALVNAGVGVGVLGAFILNLTFDDAVATRELPDRAWQRTVSIAIRQRANLSPASAEFTQRLGVEAATLKPG